MVSFHYSKYISMYSIAVTATQATIDKRPEMVEKMVTALLRGFKFTVANPAEAVKITSKLHPELDADYVRRPRSTRLLEGMWDETSKAKGIGILDAGKMQATRDTVVKYWKLKTEPPMDAALHEPLRRGRPQGRQVDARAARRRGRADAGVRGLLRSGRARCGSCGRRPSSCPASGR